ARPGTSTRRASGTGGQRSRLASPGTSLATLVVRVGAPLLARRPQLSDFVPELLLDLVEHQLAREAVVLVDDRAHALDHLSARDLLRLVRGDGSIHRVGFLHGPRLEERLL